MKTRVSFLVAFTLMLLLSSACAVCAALALTVDEVDTLKATDTVLTPIPKEGANSLQITKYNESTTPHQLTYPLWLHLPEQPLGKYINITLGDSTQGAASSVTETALVQTYYRDLELDRTGNGRSGDIGDINENSLTLYLYNETASTWKKLGKYQGLTDFGINTTNVELYGEKYSGNLWFEISLTNVSFFGLAGFQTSPQVQPPSIYYTLKINALGQGTVVPGNQTYLAGANVNIKAFDSAGWTFEGWTGDATGSTNTTITMNGNKVVTATFTQVSEPPTAAFTESAHVAPVGTAITFDASNSFDVDGKIILYEWDWDSDGTYDEMHENLVIVSHTFMIPGQYTVTLRVTDDMGLTNVHSETKIITPNLDVIPEVPMGTITATIAAFAALLVASGRLRHRKIKI